MNSFKSFTARYPKRVFSQGETLFLQGEVPEAVYIIESGFVKMYAITSGGDERLISIESKDEDIPVGYVFNLTDKSPYFYEAYTRCVVRVIPRSEFLEHLRTDTDSMRRQHLRLIALLLSSLSRINALEQSTAGDKLAHTLLYMAEQVGEVDSKFKTHLKLKMTQQEVASMLGVTRETANIELRKLELKKLMSHSRKSYILYIEQLRSYINGR